jgi:hypothetical protein
MDEQDLWNEAIELLQADIIEDGVAQEALVIDAIRRVVAERDRLREDLKKETAAAYRLLQRSLEGKPLFS